MSDTTIKPVIFLAFANDRDETVGYLRNLPDEARRLRDVLEPAEQAGLCEVIVRSNSTAGDIFKVFQDPKYRNRIAIFHYGGHANGYELLLESAEGKAAAADAGGLAAFLAQQQGLQLVFLNGCSTQQQTQELLDANISTVISTSRSIDDEVATDFAFQFYQGLAGGATICTSYNEAEASVQTAKGGNTRGLYFGDKDDSKSQLEADRWPWNLYLREGSENADQWNLPEAVNDPLFGLPPLPEQDLPESPYRHLNWFTRKDAEVFFGRGHQIRELYDRLTAPRTAPIMLFYGQSGVGKSSILDAGLIPRLEQDYEVRYLRRTAGGLLDTLQLAFLPEACDVPIDTAWRVKEEKTGKPLIVFLDQVEELYTRPIADLPDELDQLLDVVKATFVRSNERPRGKLVLGFRKEWLAELEAQLVTYELPRTKVFLEPLDRRGIIEVVQGPARSERLRERYGLTVEDGLAEIIADDLLADRDSAIAPTLQILLTKLWAKATDANYEHPQFTQELYQHLKRDGILLRDFLNQQIAAFRQRYPEAVDSGLLLDIVALHTTPLGTADQQTVEQLQQQYAHLGATLPEIIQQCQDLHLLTVASSAQKESTKTTRLAHDTLAPLVREQFDVSDKPGQRTRRILDNRSVDWEDDQTGTPLDEADLHDVEQGTSGTRVLNATEQRLVNASRDLRARLKRLRMILKAAGAVALAIIVVTAGVAVWQWNVAVEERDAKEVARKEADAQRDDALRIQSQFLADASEQQLSKGDAITAALLALEGVRDPESEIETQRIRPFVKEAFHSLESAWRSRREQAVLGGHEDIVHSGVFSPDGTRIATASHDRTARIWDAATGELIHTLTGHLGPVNTAVFNPSGTRIATASDDKTVRIWDAATGELIHTLTDHLDFVTTAVFNPSGTRLATAADDETVRIWDAVTGESLQILAGHKSGVLKTAFSPDGTHLFTAYQEQTVLVWNAETWELPRKLSHKDEVLSANFSPDGMRIVTGSKDGLVTIWDAVTGKEIIKITDHQSVVFDAVFSPDGNQIATASLDMTARLWNAVTGDSIRVFKGHEDEVYSIAFSPKSAIILTASKDNTVRLWKPTHGRAIEILSAHETGVKAAAFSPDGAQILTHSGGNLRIWKTAAGEATATLSGHQAMVYEIVFSRDGTRFATASDDKTLGYWDAATGAHIRTFSGHGRSVNGAAFSPDGAQLVSTSVDKTARIWDVATGISTHTLSHDDIVEKTAFSPDGTQIVTTCANGTVLIWNATTGERVRTLTGHKARAIGVAFSPEGDRIVTASADNTVLLWDATTGRQIRVVTKHDDQAYDAAFSPDGKHIVTTSTDKTARVCEAATGRVIHTLNGHGGMVLTAAYSTVGNRIITTCVDGTARVWDAATGEISQVFQGNPSPVCSAAFSPNGSIIVTASLDGTFRIWNSGSSHIQDLIDQIKKETPRGLTPKQRTEFFLAPEPPDWCIEMGKWPYQSTEWKKWLADRRAGRDVKMPGGADSSQ